MLSVKLVLVFVGQMTAPFKAYAILDIKRDVQRQQEAPVTSSIAGHLGMLNVKLVLVFVAQMTVPSKAYAILDMILVPC